MTGGRSAALAAAGRATLLRPPRRPRPTRCLASTARWRGTSSSSAAASDSTAASAAVAAARGQRQLRRAGRGDSAFDADWRRQRRRGRRRHRRPQLGQPGPARRGRPWCAPSSTGRAGRGPAATAAPSSVARTTMSRATPTPRSSCRASAGLGMATRLPVHRGGHLPGASHAADGVYRVTDIEARTAGAGGRRAVRSAAGCWWWYTSGPAPPPAHLAARRADHRGLGTPPRPRSRADSGARRAGRHPGRLGVRGGHRPERRPHHRRRVAVQGSMHNPHTNFFNSSAPGSACRWPGRFRRSAAPPRRWPAWISTWSTSRAHSRPRLTELAIGAATTDDAFCWAAWSSRSRLPRCPMRRAPVRMPPPPTPAPCPGRRPDNADASADGGPDPDGRRRGPDAATPTASAPTPAPRAR